jgi:transposase-like protein
MLSAGGTVMAQAKIRIVTKDPTEKLARQRLSVLQLAQALGSVSAACRRSGMDRTSFYDWKRRFQTHGLDGLKSLSRT